MPLLSSARSQGLPQSSFVGCLRNFQVDSKPLDSPSARVAVSPCEAGALEKGLYFPLEGGRVTLGEERGEEGVSGLEASSFVTIDQSIDRRGLMSLSLSP